MQYMLLIFDDERVWGELSEEERGRLYAEYGTFTNELRDAGALVTADQLQPSTTATLVQVRDGETLTTDGPFAETKEILGGYYLIEADDLDGALDVAGRIPAARMGGAVEVRPVVEM